MSLVLSLSRMEAKAYGEIRNLFTEYLTEKKLRRTEERYTIFEHICAFPGHFDMCMLCRELENDNFHVCRATVYNTVEVLVEAGLVVRHQLSAQSVQYELRILADTHLHLVCTRCGSVREISHAPFGEVLGRLKMARFTPEFYCLYVYGLCSKCKYRMQHAVK